MFLRRTKRKKAGKTHVYWNIVENKRLDDGRVVQRHVLYLGEINASQAVAWRKWLIALSQAPPYLAAAPRSRPDLGSRFGRRLSRLGAFRLLSFDAVGRA